MNRIVGCVLAAVAGILLMATPSAALDCGGVTVNYVWTYVQSGTLVATVDGGPLSSPKGLSLCDLNSTVGGIDPDMCRAVYNQLMIAKTTGVTVTIRFSNSIENSSGQPALSCDEIQGFNLNAVAPYFLWLRVNN